MHEALVEPGLFLRVDSFSGIGKTIQKVVRCNRLPCLRNWLFPKSVHPGLGLIGVPNAVVVDLEEIDARDGWILDNWIDRQGST